jgi:hypothetical protein
MSGLSPLTGYVRNYANQPGKSGTFSKTHALFWLHFAIGSTTSRGIFHASFRDSPPLDPALPYGPGRYMEASVPGWGRFVQNAEMEDGRVAGVVVQIIQISMEP